MTAQDDNRVFHDDALFVWRWNVDRKIRITSFTLIGALYGAGIGAVCAFAWTNPNLRAAWAPSLITMFALALPLACDFVKSGFWRLLLRWSLTLAFAVVMLALLFAWQPPEASDLSIMARYALPGSLAGGIVAFSVYRTSEVRFQRLLREGVSIPMRRPLPSLTRPTFAGVFFGLTVLALGSVMIIAIFVRH